MSASLLLAGATRDACTHVPQDPRDGTWPHLPARPWRYVGHSRCVYQAIPGDPSCPIQPGTSCDHCGTGISNVYTFEATRTGERFKVGSSCIYKMLQVVRTRSLTAAEAAIRGARNEAARERREIKERTLRQQAQTLIDAHRDALAAQPHPQPWRAEKGETAADWADWMLRACGLPGMRRFVAQLETITGVAS